jgi:MFS family permease
MSDFKKTFDFAQYSADSLANIRGWVTSVVVLGGMIGALTAAPLTDHLGRKWSLFVVAIILYACISTSSFS